MKDEMQKLLALLFLYLPSLLTVAHGQIFRGNASGSNVPEFQIHEHADSLFIFDADSSRKFLTARSSTGDTALFTLGRFNPGGRNYNEDLAVETDSFTISVETDRGYRLIIQEDSRQDTFYCWALIDSFQVLIISGEEDVIDGETVYKIPDGPEHKACHLIKGLEAVFLNTRMEYYHWETGAEYLAPWHSINIRNNWTSSDTLSDRDLVVGYDPYTYVDIEKPTYNDVWYRFRVRDRYNVVAQDSIYNESIEPHANFSYQYIPRTNYEYYPQGIEDDAMRNRIYGGDSSKVSAPAVYIFKNYSENFRNAIWHLGDTNVTLTSDTTIAEARDSLVHTYKLPGTYRPQLIVFNVLDYLYDACADSLPDPTGLYEPDGEAARDNSEFPIVVEEAGFKSDAGLPNVMTCPNGDNSNFFRFTGDVSIGFFHIRIFNRYGKMVYEYSGDMIAWEGWDGKNMHSGKYVNTGVYYYVVKKFEMLPDYETGKVPNLFYQQESDNSSATANKTAFANPSETAGSGTGAANGQQSVSKETNNILRGFFHVYNNEN